MIREFIYRLGQRRRSRRLRERVGSYGGATSAPARPPRPRGECPRGTPDCHYADCSDARERSCYGPCAPQHVDMGP